MPAAFPVRWQIQWRLDTANKRLAVALLASLAIHATIFVAWKTAPALVSFARLVASRVLNIKPSPAKSEVARSEPRQLREVAMTFVEVDPATASKEPPKETKFYSTQNSIAANPEPKKEDAPKIDGSQTKMLRIADVPKPNPQPLQPSPPPEPKPVETAPEEVKPKPAEPVGDLALAKRPPAPAQSDGDKITEQPPRTRPRTLAQARQNNPSLVGLKTKQEGGVERRAHVSMVDAKGSPFGDYDAAFISAVQMRWYQLLDNNQYMLDRRGKVVLTFRLHYDGRITAMDVDTNEVGEILGLLCQKAILDPAPFPKWPRDMRQMVREDYRDVKFTFYYD